MKTAALIVAFAFVALVLAMWRSAPAAAQTQEERAACTGDAMKFCGPEISQGQTAITACMRKHRAQLSKECAEAIALRKR